MPTAKKTRLKRNQTIASSLRAAVHLICAWRLKTYFDSEGIDTITGLILPLIGPPFAVLTAYIQAHFRVEHTAAIMDKGAELAGVSVAILKDEIAEDKKRENRQKGMLE